MAVLPPLLRAEAAKNQYSLPPRLAGAAWWKSGD
jgi:hypothetical protein